MNLEVISREPKIKRFATLLLFVHGTGHAAWCWDENFLPYFAEKGFSSHAVSLRGHGKSEGRDRLKWTSISEYVADVFQIAESLPQSPIVIGHSLGGLVVMKYLEKHSAPAAILFAPSPSEGMFWAGLPIFLENPLLFLEVSLKQDYAAMFATPERAKKFLFSADADDEKIAEYVQKFGSESYLANLEMIYNLPNLPQAKTPILALGAENDKLVPTKKIEKTARFYNAEHKIFPDMAHDMMLENGWQKVADFMIQWLEKKIR